MFVSVCKNVDMKKKKNPDKSHKFALEKTEYVLMLKKNLFQTNF